MGDAMKGERNGDRRARRTGEGGKEERERPIDRGASRTEERRAPLSSHQASYLGCRYTAQP